MNGEQVLNAVVSTTTGTLDRALVLSRSTVRSCRVRFSNPNRPGGLRIVRPSLQRSKPW